ncbi:ogr/Delta-like zinc finger family protein [Endozoicomonas ascidiicola]|uniref:ogr/Delta-like zinc finger family protein n=1 Tax=Endozoicomonas ascidiicola TaxID=1698521 RepID=UPI000831EF42|nr:ogr/Delta-like zinc finger family protein [Endozoicomonas ascidiicola]
MSVRVRCNRCNEIATIQDSVEDSAEFKTLYCTCNNHECGHAFVTHLTFSHTLSPSALDFTTEMMGKLRQMNRQQQRELFASLT